MDIGYEYYFDIFTVMFKYILCFSINEHPITQLLYKCQYSTYNKLQPLLTKYSKVFDQHTLKRDRSKSVQDQSSDNENESFRDRSKSDGSSLQSTDTGYSSIATMASGSSGYSSLPVTISGCHSTKATTPSGTTNRSKSIEEKATTSKRIDVDSSQIGVIMEGTEVFEEGGLLSSDEETYESVKNEIYHLQPCDLESLESDALEV